MLDYFTAASKPTFEFSHEEQHTGGTKYPSKVTLRAHHPETGEVQGELKYFPPKRKGGIATVDGFGFLNNGPARGAHSALMNEMESRHPGSRVVHMDDINEKSKPKPGDPNFNANRDYGLPTDWDTHYPKLPGQIHRGMGVRLESWQANKIHSANHSAAEQAKVLHDAVRDGGPGGMHWSADPKKPVHFAERNVRDPRTDIPVILHADTPEFKNIETRPNVLRQKGVWPHDHHAGDAEVPIAKGKPVNITGVSWLPEVEHPEADEHGWVHHTFDEPLVRKASRDFSDYFGGTDGRVLHTAGRGKPRRDGGGAGASPQGSSGGAPQGGEAGPGDSVGAGQGGTRSVEFHPRAVKDLQKLDGPMRSRAKKVVDALAAGDEGLQTHALYTNMKGWYSTKVNHDHRIVHRPTDDGGLHIVYVGLHGYDEAARRIGSLSRDPGPVTFPYLRNTEGASNLGSMYGQDIEPHGRYLSYHAGEKPEGDRWETGQVSFDNPLHVDFGGNYGDPSNWKHQLSGQFGGKKGKALSRAVVKAGHDGIITHDEYGPSEIVDLTHFKAKTSATLDDLAHHQRAVAEAQSAVREQYPSMLTAIQRGPDADDALRHMLKQHGHPRHEDAFVSIHDGTRSFSSTAKDRETGAVGVVLHPTRADYGTLAHEAAHLLHDHQTGRGFREPAPDESVHGIGFIGHYAKLLEPFGKNRTPGGNRKGGGPGDLLLNTYYDSLNRNRKTAAADEHRPLPPKLYHVTTARDAVLEHGLKTRDELGQQYGHGLGSGPDDTISLTSHKPTAEHLLHSLHEYHDVLNGKIPLTELKEKARNGVGAKKPYDFMFDPYDHSDQKLAEIDAGHVTEPRFHVLGQEPEGWKPLDEGMTGQDGSRAHMLWDRPLDEKEKIKHRAEVYSKFAWGRQASGGHMDPLFMGNSPREFAKKDPSQFALLHVRPQSGAYGVHVNDQTHGTDAGEWRVHSGHDLDVVHHEGLEDIPSRVASHPLPTSRVFGPTFGLDHRLFEGEHLKPEVRAAVMGRLGPVIEPLLGQSWEAYTKVYLAGSEASEWTSATLEGNGDFDTLIGIDYDHARDMHSPIHDLADADITDLINTALRTVYNASPWVAPFGGTWDLTGYCNAGSYDITKIKPYAAYNISDDAWSVRPPHLPDWSIEKLPEGGDNLLAEAEGYAAVIDAIDKMPEPFRTQQGKSLWKHLHSDRGRAFSDEGEGWLDPGNLIEKALVEWGVWDKLVEWQYGKQHTAAVDPPTIKRGVILDGHPYKGHTEHGWDPGGWDADVAHRLVNGTATHHDVLKHVDTNNVGHFWYHPDHADLEDAQTFAEPREPLDNWLDDPQEDGRISGEAGVVMEAHHPEGWDPDKNNPSHPLMGNSYLPDHSHLKLHKLHYTTDGEKWHTIPMEHHNITLHTDGPGEQKTAASAYDPDDDDHYRSYTDWDKAYSRLPEDIHRGVAVQLPAELHDAVHDESRPEAERAHAVLQGATLKPLGMHWSAASADMAGRISHDEVEQLTPRERRNTTHVVLHADRPERQHIEDDIDRLVQHSVISHGRSPENEVPLKEGSPVNVWGVSWKHHDAPDWNFHEFDEPMHKMAIKSSDHEHAPDLPEEQHEALTAEPLSAYWDKTLQVAKDRKPGTHMWRGETRSGDPVQGARETGVGMHWGVNPSNIVFPHPSDDDGKEEASVVYHAELEHPDEQSYPRSHPMWRGKHQSLDHEAEIRLKPGSKVKLHGVWVKDPKHPDPGYFIPRMPERMSSAWSYHPIGEHVTVAHRPKHNMIDYGDVGIGKEGNVIDITAYFKTASDDDDYRMMHRPPNEQNGRPLHHLDPDDEPDEDEHVRIYRSAPPHVDHFDTNTWATTNPAYAHQHGRHPTDPSQDWPVMSAEVPKSHVYTDFNDDNEVGYQGPRLEANELEQHHEETGHHTPFTDYQPPKEDEPEEHKPKKGEMWGSHVLKLSPEDYKTVTERSFMPEAAKTVLKHLGNGVTWHPKGSKHTPLTVDDQSDHWHAETHAEMLMGAQHPEGGHEPGTAPLLGVVVHTKNGKTIDRVGVNPHVDYSDKPSGFYNGFKNLPVSRAAQHPSLKAQSAKTWVDYFGVAA